MSESRIVRYNASWDTAARTGVLEFGLQGGDSARLEVADAAEFALLLQLLRRDSDPWLVDGTIVSTGQENPGR
jgi:hypothetical protein